MDSADAWFLWLSVRRAEIAALPPHQVYDALYDHCKARQWTDAEFDRWLVQPCRALGNEVPTVAVAEGRGADVWVALAMVDAPRG